LVQVIEKWPFKNIGNEILSKRSETIAKITTTKRFTYLKKLNLVTYSGIVLSLSHFPPLPYVPQNMTLLYQEL